MGHLKIVVKIPDTIYPELVADLERVQLRDRAERVRVLAMLGLKHFGAMKMNDACQDLGIDRSLVQEHQSKSATSRLIRKLSDDL